MQGLILKFKAIDLSHGFFEFSAQVLIVFNHIGATPSIRVVSKASLILF